MPKSVMAIATPTVVRVMADGDGADITPEIDANHDAAVDAIDTMCEELGIDIMDLVIESITDGGEDAQ